MSFSAPLKGLYGLYQTHEASKALRKLAGQPDPQYRSAIDILDEAKANTQRGFTAQEEADFNSSLARNSSQRFRTATDINPNLAGAVTAATNYGNLGALNRFAADSSRLREANTQRLVGDITQQSNANTTDAIRRKREKEMAYGEAYRAGVANIAGVLDSIDRDAATLTSVLSGMPAGGSTTPLRTGTPLGANQIPSQGAENPASTVGSQDWLNSLYPSPTSNAYNVAPPLAPSVPLGMNPPANSATNPAPFSYDWYRNSLGF